MTINGWLQIALFGLIVIVITRPHGGYMTRVFAGEWTPLRPLLRPVERFVYWGCGVDETEEQPWHIYAVSMLFFGVAGFVTLYALQRLQWYLPFNPQKQAGVEQVLAFNTSVSFVTNTNWQSFVPETTMGYLVQMAGLTALTNVLGRMVKDERQGWAIFAAMGILLVVGVTTTYWSESHGNPGFSALDVDAASSGLQAGATWRARRSASASPRLRSSRP